MPPSSPTVAPAAEARVHGPSCHGSAEGSPGELERNGPTSRNRHPPPTNCNKTQAHMHDTAEITPLLQREEAEDSGNDLRRHCLGVRGGGRGGDRKGRPRSRRWRRIAGIAGVVMFSLALLGLGLTFKIIQTERTHMSSLSALQQMPEATTRSGGTGPGSRTPGQPGEAFADIANVCVLVWLCVRDCKLVQQQWYHCIFLSAVGLVEIMNAVVACRPYLSYSVRRHHLPGSTWVT